LESTSINHLIQISLKAGEMRGDIAWSHAPHFAGETIWFLSSARQNMPSAKSEGNLGSIIQHLTQDKGG